MLPPGDVYKPEMLESVLHCTLGRKWPVKRLGRLAKRTWPDGRSASLRWILCRMIEEYARHNGHADLLRESIDGATGE